MKSSLQLIESATIIADDICLRKQSKNISYIIVEGGFDKKTLQKFFNLDICDLYPTNTKNYIIEVIQELLKRGKNDCIAIRDRDYDVLINEDILELKNVFFTDYRDLEMTILNTKSINDALVFFKEDIPSHEGIIEFVLNTIKPIGMLRWLNDKENLGISFKNTSITNYIDKKSLELSFDNYMLALIQNTNKKSLEMGNEKLPFKRDDLKIKYLEFIDETRELIDNKYICNGHDFIDVLIYSLQNSYAKQKAKDLSSGHFEKMLSLAYNFEFFKESKIYSKIKTWETSNIKILCS